MKRVRPILQNERDIPVHIFKRDKLIAECPNIQDAAKFFKEETGSKRFNWSAINKGIWDDEPYSVNGATYYFVTAKEAVKRKMTS